MGEGDSELEGVLGDVEVLGLGELVLEGRNELGVDFEGEALDLL
eukprot:CAMPEP_0168624492 /NCGR_PEP_ID=MMETSP0449_2-20121227/9440_1 /TAXON_ID=1082188 /ORGANISM="Strombidium rassoulzadegani, Strain ras09" /LENGTH=43 /DNA_ID= /DNA_START= /DNA_END= /DNA_ORIENTATION=